VHALSYQSTILLSGTENYETTSSQKISFSINFLEFISDQWIVKLSANPTWISTSEIAQKIQI